MFASEEEEMSAYGEPSELMIKCVEAATHQKKGKPLQLVPIDPIIKSRNHMKSSELLDLTLEMTLDLDKDECSEEEAILAKFVIKYP